MIPSSVFPKNETANETVYFVYYKSSKLFAPNYQRIEVCRDGFTSSRIGKVESRGSAYTVERVASRGLVTESSPVMSASLKGREVANLTEPVIIMFKLPPEMVRIITITFLCKKSGFHYAYYYFSKDILFYIFSI